MRLAALLACLPLALDDGFVLYRGTRAHLSRTDARGCPQDQNPGEATQDDLVNSSPTNRGETKHHSKLGPDVRGSELGPEARGSVQSRLPWGSEVDQDDADTGLHVEAASDGLVSS